MNCRSASNVCKATYAPHSSEIEQLTRKLARADFQSLLDNVVEVAGIPILAAQVDVPDADTLREMADWFRDKMQGGVIVLGTVINEKPLLIAATTKDAGQDTRRPRGQPRPRTRADGGRRRRRSSRYGPGRWTRRIQAAGGPVESARTRRKNGFVAAISKSRFSQTPQR